MYCMSAHGPPHFLQSSKSDVLFPSAGGPWFLSAVVRVDICNQIDRAVLQILQRIQESVRLVEGSCPILLTNGRIFGSESEIDYGFLFRVVDVLFPEGTLFFQKSIRKTTVYIFQKIDPENVGQGGNNLR